MQPLVPVPVPVLVPVSVALVVPAVLVVSVVCAKDMPVRAAADRRALLLYIIFIKVSLELVYGLRGLV